MSVRPSLMHLIGINKNLISNFDEWKNNFYNQYYEEDFWDVTKSIWNRIEEKDFSEDLKKHFNKKLMMDYIYIPDEDSEIDVIGLKPVYSNESYLYGHELLYTMVESGVLNESQSIFKKIPYEDYSDYIGMNIKDIRKKAGLLVAREMDYYRGSWGRRYPNHPLYYYDKEFDFIFELFKSWGFNINKKDIDRYLLFEWK